MSASIWKKELFANIGSLAMCKRVFQHETKPEGEIPFYKIGTFGSEPDAYISKTLFDEYKKLFSYPNKGDILISASGTIGRTVIFDGKPSYFQDSNIMWLAHDESKILNEYLYFLYKTIRWNLEGSTIKRLYTDNFKKIGIIFPKNIEEQKKIANILSTCDTVIQNTQKTIDKYKAIKQGMMQDLFTRGITKDGKLRLSYKEAPELYKESELGMIPKEWKVESFGNLVTMHARIGWQNLRTTEFLDSGDYYLITGTDFEDGKVNFETCHYVSKNRFEQDKNIQVQVGSILITKDGTLGKVAYIDKLSKPATLNAGVFNIVTKNDDIVQNYLYHFLTSPALMNYALQRATGGTIKHLNQNILVKFPVICPPKDEQENIAKSLSAIAKSILKEEAILEKYKNIKTGLMARLLTPPEDAEIIDETGE